MPDLIIPLPVFGLSCIKCENEIQRPVVYFTLDITLDLFSVLEF